MKLYDATLAIHEKMVIFPGDPPFKKEPVSQIQTGDDVNLTRITMGTHLGTHVDPPAHFIENGATVDQLSLETLVGIDYLSIEHHENPGSPVHHLLLEAGVLVAEGVHLLEIPPGEYEIFCLPLKIKGADGAPARILLRG